ncbi:hypothetical protein RFI_08081 [Reticulomyxa filosa]|uniref:Uncharacterized protein n=1 Tax=Reticulomyxa filosa TaxID=46433 RepID=X6NSW5_RETFI|nr:hypothetical protein RFI_08081 [Reticulomyxa filosa]|eukprot:ETO29043.1 hypothetical protein RFI_08081 [Reticulomyxa filosa]
MNWSNREKCVLVLTILIFQFCLEILRGVSSSRETVRLSVEGVLECNHGHTKNGSKVYAVYTDGNKDYFATIIGLHYALRVKYRSKYPLVVFYDSRHTSKEQVAILRDHLHITTYATHPKPFEYPHCRNCNPQQMQKLSILSCHSYIRTCMHMHTNKNFKKKKNE